MNKKYFLILLLFIGIMPSYGQYTGIPDANFEAALEALGYDDISGDKQVPTALISDITALDLSFKSIRDLTGMEDFVALQILELADNPVTGLDITAMVDLEELNIEKTSIFRIDLSQNTKLKKLDIGYLLMYDLDVSNNPLLEEIIATYAKLENITLGDITSLKKLDFFKNSLTSLDLSAQTALVELNVQDNDLSYLNIQNGNNGNVTSFNATGNEDLTCILVDDASDFLDLWSGVIDAHTIFNDIDCRYTAIPDENFEARLEQLGYDDISGDFQVPTALIETVTSLNVSSKGIADFTGLEDFAALITLDASWNSMSTLDLSALSNLEVLDLSFSPITSLDVSNNFQLKELSLNDNGDLVDLDLSNNDLLEYLAAPKKGLDKISFGGLTNLKEVWLRNNNLQALDFSTATALEVVFVGLNDLNYLNLQNGNNELITAFDSTGNSNLTCILVDDASANNDNLANIDSQTSFSDTYCRYTAIPDANFEGALEALGYDDIADDGQVPTALIENVTSLSIGEDSIEEVTGLEDFTALTELELYQVGLPSIDLSNNTLIENLNLSGNPLSEINLSDLTNLKELYLDNTDITILDLSANTALTKTEVTNSDHITTINFKNGTNANLEEHDFRGNPNLTCILVDDATNGTADWTNIDVQTSFSDTYCRYTTIPDANFEAALEALGYDDISGDGRVPTALIENITTLSVGSQNIVYFAGIQDFTSLLKLTVINNQMATIDVSALTVLQDLDVGLCTNLTSLDISANEQLRELHANDANLSTLILGDIIELREIEVANNSLSELDFSNLLEPYSIDVSGNNLTYFNLKYGNNGTIESIDVRENDNLSCVLVDDASDFSIKWSGAIDAHTSFSDTYCRYTTIHDANFEAALEALGYDDISGDKQVPTALIENVTSLSIGDDSIEEVTGLEDFSALTELVLYQVGLLTIDLSNNTLIETLNLSGNPLSEIDLSDLTNLTELYLDNTNITSLDLSTNASLTKTEITNNDSITTINFKNGTNDKLTEHDFRGNPNLTCILVDNVNFSAFNWAARDDQTSFSEVSCSTDFSLALKVYLQGAALNPNTGEEDLMRDDLRVAAVLPTTSPYNDGLTCDTTVFDITGNDAIVDWVWVELRDQNDAASIVEGTSALLQRDGDIVAVDGASNVAFSVAADNYYVMITHRNHLGIRSANTISLSTTVASLDLTSGTSLIEGGSNAVVDMGNGIYAILAGDQNADGQIQNTDINTVITLLGGSGYHEADMNMDGQIQNTDINNLMNPNLGKGEQF